MLEGQAVGLVTVVVLADKLGRDFHLFETHHHPLQAPAQQVDEGRRAVGVMDGHVEQRGQLFAHGVQHEGDATGLGLEQVLEWRVLLRLFGGRQAGAFEEVEH